MLILNLNNATNGFAPGAVVSGLAGWRRHQPPREACVRLFWYTEGKGTQDIAIAAEQMLSGRDMDHEEPFSLQLPDQPYSCSGVLLSIRWAVELVVNGGKEAERVDILVAPWVQEPRLVKLDVQDPLLKVQVQSW